jgi:hypothetical protein
MSTHDSRFLRSARRYARINESSLSAMSHDGMTATALTSQQCHPRGFCAGIGPPRFIIRDSPSVITKQNYVSNDPSSLGRADGNVLARCAQQDEIGHCTLLVKLSMILRSTSAASRHPGGGIPSKTESKRQKQNGNARVCISRAVSRQPLLALQFLREESRILHKTKTADRCRNVPEFGLSPPEC